MKKTKQVIVDMFICDICGKEITHRTPYNQERFTVLKGLVKMEKFDAHEVCVNKTIREAFKKFTK